jgi:hypothetical protein
MIKKMMQRVRPGRIILNAVAKIICWFRLVSVILNPPPSTNKFSFIADFARESRLQANSYLSEKIASKCASLAKDLLASRPWKGSFPEQQLWEGNDSIKPVQPSRIPIRLLDEMTSQLNSFGIELLTKDFIQGVINSSSERIATIYVEFDEEITSDVALQILADLLFLQIALSTTAFSHAKEKFLNKVFIVGFGLI